MPCHIFEYIFNLIKKKYWGKNGQGGQVGVLAYTPELKCLWLSCIVGNAGPRFLTRKIKAWEQKDAISCFAVSTWTFQSVEYTNIYIYFKCLL